MVEAARSFERAVTNHLGEAHRYIDLGLAWEVLKIFISPLENSGLRSWGISPVQHPKDRSLTFMGGTSFLIVEMASMIVFDGASTEYVLPRKIAIWLLIHLLRRLRPSSMGESSHWDPE